MSMVFEVLMSLLTIKTKNVETRPTGDFPRFQYSYVMFFTIKIISWGRLNNSKRMNCILTIIVLHEIKSNYKWLKMQWHFNNQSCSLRVKVTCPCYFKSCRQYRHRHCLHVQCPLFRNWSWDNFGLYHLRKKDIRNVMTMTMLWQIWSLTIILEIIEILTKAHFGCNSHHCAWGNVTLTLTRIYTSSIGFVSIANNCQEDSLVNITTLSYLDTR